MEVPQEAYSESFHPCQGALARGRVLRDGPSVTLFGELLLGGELRPTLRHEAPTELGPAIGRRFVLVERLSHSLLLARRVRHAQAAGGPRRAPALPAANQGFRS